MADELQTKRIIELAQKTEPEAGDNLAVDNATSGTRRILWENLLDGNLADDKKAAPAGATGRALEENTAKCINLENEIYERYESLINKVYTIPRILETGYISGGTGEDVADSRYVRTAGYIKSLTTEITMTVPDGYQALTYKYDHNKELLGTIYWRTGTATIDVSGATYVRFCIGMKTATSISVELVSGFEITCTNAIYTYVDSAVTDNAVAAVIMGASTNYINVDTKNKVVTFPADSVIVNPYNSGQAYYILNGSICTCDYSSISSSAVKIYYDQSTNTWLPATYAQKITGKILVGVIRSVANSSNNSAFFGAPFVVDGRFMGKDLTENLGISINYFVKGINHRGYNLEAPENTLPAFILSKKKGFSYVETDVAFTSDNVAVLLHDETVDRTSNGTGNISQLTYSYVSGLDFGSWFSPAYAGTHIPTLDQFIRLCRDLSLHAYIELKEVTAYTQAQIESIVDTVKKYRMEKHVSYISFSLTFLSYVKNYDASARLGYLVNTLDDSAISQANTLKTQNNEVFLDVYISADNLTDENVAKVRNANMDLEVWVTNTISTINEMNGYISGVTSDQVNAGAVLCNTALNS